MNNILAFTMHDSAPSTAASDHKDANPQPDNDWSQVKVAVGDSLGFSLAMCCRL